MSLYLPESRALFLHIPRTGGMWIKECLNHCGIERKVWNRCRIHTRIAPKHMLVPHFPKDDLQKVDFVFSFIRHPLTWYESTWRKETFDRNSNKHQMKSKSSWSPTIITRRHYNSNFLEWVKMCIEEEPGWLTRVYELFVGPEEVEFCDFIGRTENLADDFFEVLKILGYNTKELLSEIQKVKEKNRVPIEEVPHVLWDKKTKKLLLRSERVAIKRFYGELN